jgi:glycosyltransferase involved in cell wall biosynthesis
MNYGLATIVNSNGAMADLPSENLWKLADEFGDDELVAALQTLWRDDARRRALGARAQELICRVHDPALCADLYADALERVYRKAETGVPGLIRHLTKAELLPNDAELLALADDIAGIEQMWCGQRQFLVDVSILVQLDAKTGIQRVVRSLLNELLSNPPDGYRLEPVYATPEQGYRYARRFTLQFLDCPETDLGLADDPIDLGPGDIFLGLDLSHHVAIARCADFEKMRNRGVQVWFVVYDLLPVIMPEVFPEVGRRLHTDWLMAIARHGNAICISRAVAEELSSWVSRQVNNEQMRFCKIRSFHLGADVTASVPTRGIPKQAREVLKQLQNKQSFLMVGTIEPRKCHSQVLEGFECLWGDGHDINLVIVGKHGWKVDALVEKIQNHPQLGDRLFWLKGISDEYLEEIYSACSCLVAASAGEGFGLPLIEAAQHQLPIIARDIPVFREVAGEFAYYFCGCESQDIALAVKDWVALNSVGNAPQSVKMPWLTWRQSTQQLLDAVLPQAE